MDKKKILVFLGLLAVTAAIGFALYYLFFRPAPPELPPEVPVNVPIAPLPPALPGVPPTVVPGVPPELPPGVTAVAEGGVTLVTPLTDVPTTSASLASDGTLSYYNRIDGKFYKMNADGTVSSLSGKIFHNVDNAIFDPNGNKAIIEYPDGSNIYYDFTTDRQVTLPKHWEEFDFSPAGDQITAKSIGIDPSNRFLIVSNPDGSAARPVQELGDNADKVQVAWSPNNQMIATATTGESYGIDGKEVFFIGQHGENFKSMVVQGLDFRPKWAPDGEQLLYSVAGSLSDYKPSLWVVDASGDNVGNNRRSLNVDTWADKCTFHGTSTLYCAVPTELPRGAGLQPGVAADTPDNLYKIDLDTGLMTLLAIPETEHTIGTIMVTPDESTLYFTDQASGLLNQIQLK